jgi:hypothetical protein
MVRSSCRAVAFAALWVLSAFSAFAQQAPENQVTDGYKPPARFIAKETDKPYRPSLQPEATAPASNLKTIGIASMVGDTFTVKSITSTGFDSEERKFPASNWKIDDRVAASVGRILKKSFRVKPVQIPAGEFQKFRKSGFPPKSFEAELAKFVSRYAAGQKSDYLLVVYPASKPVGPTSQEIEGLGVVRWGVLSSGEYVHALSALTVYDAQMKRIRSEFLSTGQDGFLAAVKGPNQELKEGSRLPPDPKAAFADPRAQKIAWELLDKSLAMTLPKLFAVD